MSCHSQPYVDSCSWDPNSHYDNEGFEPYNTNYYSNAHQHYGDDTGSYGHPELEQDFGIDAQRYIHSPCFPYEDPYGCSPQYGQCANLYSARYFGPFAHRTRKFNYQDPDICSGGCWMISTPPIRHRVPGYYEHAWSPVIVDTLEDVTEFSISRDRRPTTNGVRIRGSSKAGSGRRGKEYYRSYGGSGCGMM